MKYEDPKTVVPSKGFFLEPKGFSATQLLEKHSYDEPALPGLNKLQKTKKHDRLLGWPLKAPKSCLFKVLLFGIGATRYDSFMIVYWNCSIFLILLTFSNKISVRKEGLQPGRSCSAIAVV